jgi:hypothetical protein
MQAVGAGNTGNDESDATGLNRDRPALEKLTDSPRENNLVIGDCFLTRNSRLGQAFSFSKILWFYGLVYGIVKNKRIGIYDGAKKRVEQATGKKFNRK